MSKEKKLPLINYTKCMACGECITFCPFSCLDFLVKDLDKYKKLYPGLSEKGKTDCTSCGICASKCPIAVIQMSAP